MRKESRLPPTSVEVYLRARPDGMVDPDRDFATRRVPVPDPESIAADDVLVRVLFVSCDPAMRGWMSTAPSYLPPVEIGTPMRAHGVGEIVRSRSKLYSAGDLVSGMFGWREYVVMRGKSLTRLEIPRGVPVSVALGILGGTGMTAYFGLLDVGKPMPGDVVVVSAAAGATGSAVAQIAKNVVGCHTIGIAGGAKKCAYLIEELIVDAAVDYKDAAGLDASLKRALAGRKVDVYFDSIGGETLEVVLRRINIGARIVLCGAISRYNEKSGTSPGARAQTTEGPRNYTKLITRRASMRGFIVLDYADRYAAARRELARWLEEGRITARETRFRGVEQAPQALLGLFQGKNVGKVVVEVASLRDGEEDTSFPQVGRSKL